MLTRTARFVALGAATVTRLCATLRAAQSPRPSSPSPASRTWWTTTLRLGHHKTINAYGFGLGLVMVVCAFVAVVTMWLAIRLGPLLLQ